jgi:Protein of unknown function (DUF2961)
VSSFDPADLLIGHESRAVTFENPTGARGAGGTARDGRKGAPNRLLRPGERVVLADLAGPGRVTHLWLTVGELRSLGAPTPTFLRSQVLEVFYDDLTKPSVSVPVPDFFGVVHGVPASYASSLTAANEGMGLESRIPMPFDGRIRVEYVNAFDELALLYYQADVLLGPRAGEGGRLHAMFHRDNPTVLGRDLVILDGLHGPGRYLGMTGGVRPFDSYWWGEGEVKVYLDGETLPTICGTGTEDYLGSAWSMGTFAAPESGAPLVVGPSASGDRGWSLVSYYRWHVSDPVLFNESARVTLQQIGSAMFRDGEEHALEHFKAEVTPAGDGWIEGVLGGGVKAFTLYERSDDWCATGFAYCAEPQPVPPLDVAAATADLGGVPAGHVAVRR